MKQCIICRTQLRKPDMDSTGLNQIIKKQARALKPSTRALVCNGRLFHRNIAAQNQECTVFRFKFAIGLKFIVGIKLDCTRVELSRLGL